LSTLGGFLDATGVGAWGPVVSRTLIGLNNDVKKMIGTVIIAVFFVTLAETTAFVALIGDFVAYAEIVIRLILGGVIAAPIVAVVCKKLSIKKPLIYVGLLVITMDTYELYMFFM